MWQYFSKTNRLSIKYKIMTKDLTATKQLMEKANILPDLKLGIKKEGGGTESTGPHKVKIIGDKLCNTKDFKTQEVVPAVKYILEEEGTEKQYIVKVKSDTGELNYFIQRMAQFKVGDIITLEMKKKGIKNYIEITKDGETSEEELQTIDLDEENSEELPDEIDPKDIPF